MVGQSRESLYLILTLLVDHPFRLHLTDVVAPVVTAQSLPLGANDVLDLEGEVDGRGEERGGKGRGVEETV